MDSLAVFRTSRIIIMISGAILIIVGLAMIILQLNHDLALNNMSARTTEGGEADSKLTGTYLGLIVITFGWLLEVVGFLKNPPN